MANYESSEKLVPFAFPYRLRTSAKLSWKSFASDFGSQKSNSRAQHHSVALTSGQSGLFSWTTINKHTLGLWAWYYLYFCPKYNESWNIFTILEMAKEISIPLADDQICRLPLESKATSRSCRTLTNPFPLRDVFETNSPWFDSWLKYWNWKDLTDRQTSYHWYYIHRNICWASCGTSR